MLIKYETRKWAQHSLHGPCLPHLIPGHNINILGGRSVGCEPVEDGGEGDL